MCSSGPIVVHDLERCSMRGDCGRCNALGAINIVREPQDARPWVIVVGEFAFDVLDPDTLQSLTVEHASSSLCTRHTGRVWNLTEFAIGAFHLRLRPEHQEEAREHEDEIEWIEEHGVLPFRKGDRATITIPAASVSDEPGSYSGRTMRLVRSRGRRSSARIDDLRGHSVARAWVTPPVVIKITQKAPDSSSTLSRIMQT